MKVKPRRALIWGGMFVLAYVGGSWLGRFVVAGVDVHPANQMTGFALPTTSDPANGSVAAHVPEKQFHDSKPANHVCTGCDAGETRYRQMAQQMGLPVADETGKPEEESGQARADAYAEH